MSLTYKSFQLFRKQYIPTRLTAEKADKRTMELFQQDGITNY